MKNKRYLTSNPCDKDFKDFIHIDKNMFHCPSCNRTITNISNLDDVDYYDYQGECIIANNRQLEDMRMIHPLKRFAVAAFLIFGSSLFLIPESYGQTNTSTKAESSNENEIISGRIVGSKGYGVSNSKVYIVLQDGTKIDTVTNYNGDFVLEVPKKMIEPLLKLVVIYKDGKKELDETISNSELTDINDLGDIKIGLKQKKKKRRQYVRGSF